MYVLQNAWKSIVRNKGRNILLGIIALIIALSGCLALSIRQAAETAREDALSQMSITAQISFDRTSAMKDMAGEPPEKPDDNGEGGGFDRENFDFESLAGETLTLDDYMTYTEALSDGDGYYYTMTASLNASGDLVPYGDSETDSDTTGTEEETTQENMTPPDGQPGGMGGNMMGGRGGFSVQGDFSITGYSSYTAMLSLFGEDGSLSITDGQMFDEESSDPTCVISDELALYNDLSVGDTITLANPNYEDETYELTVSGIYTNASSDEGNSMFSRSDPANNIYMNYNALSAIIDASAEADNVTEDDDGEETDAALRGETLFTYTFASVEHYESFSEKVYDLGLSEDYIVSSQDLASFENSLTPLNTLSTMAGWFFLVVLLVGGAILVVLNLFNLRERKYEIGVLAAIGMKKRKIAAQFVCELFCVTLVAFLIGTTAGACISVPVTNQLLAGQAQSSQQSSEQIAGNFGFEPGDMPQGNFNGGGKMEAMGGGDMGGRGGMENAGGPVSYITSVASATDLTVVLQLIGVGILLTIVSSLAAVVTITRYEPLKILSSRT